MHRLKTLGVIALLLVAAHSLALAATEAVPVFDTLGVGTGLVFYPRERIYHATTRCRQLDYRDCGRASEGQPANTVIVINEARTAAQLLLDYHPFGRVGAGDPLLSATRISTALVSSYGAQAEDKPLIDGVGLSYTIAALDAFRRHDALTLEVGAVWLPDAHVMRPDEHVGRASQAFSPTEREPMAAAMITIALSL